MTYVHSLPQSKTIGLIGATGKLGQEILHQVKNFPHFSISAFFSTAHPATKECAVDLLLDVSSPLALLHNLEVALDLSIPILVGTTGHATLEPLHAASRHLPIFYAPNFSLGMILMKQALLLFAKGLPCINAVQIRETHHTKKKDSPSGSAKMLADALRTSLPSLTPQIHSERRGEVVGIHEISFKTDYEEITLIHQVNSRALFAQGALLAAEFLVQQPPGLYSMEELSSWQRKFA
ncbi:MAG: hypothetical protein KGI80_05585 [Verrucomicrobiota bacterium]|nr:hypothetical protein [Verrucomicrobiota bacterium]